MKKYKFILCSNSSGARHELEKAPIGWDEQKISLLRDFQYFGLTTAITVDFQFVYDGYRFLLDEYLTYGIDMDVILRVYKNGEFLHEGKINMTDFENDVRMHTFKVDLIESSFMQKFKNRDKVKFNIKNDRSVDGNNILAAEPIEATLRPKIINLYSECDNTNVNDPVNIYHHTIPFNIILNDNPQLHIGYQISTRTDVEADIINNPDAVFYRNDKEISQAITLKLDLSILSEWKGSFIPSFKGRNSWKILLQRIDSLDAIVQTHIQETFVGAINDYGTWQKSYNLNITLDPGERLVFWLHRLKTDDGVTFTSLDFDEMSNTFETTFTYEQVDLFVYEESTYPETQCKCFLPHEVFSNVIAQMTGKHNALVSNIFGREDLGYDEDGELAYLSITKGTLIRNYSIEDQEVSISFEDLFKSYNVVGNLGVLIDGETVRIDPKDDLFTSEITVDLGEVSELKINPADEFYFNHVKIGYKTQEYEEVNGNDEFNTSNEYLNDLKAFGKTLDLISPIRGDGYGIEFARRRQASETGTEDYRSDNDIFFIDLVKSGGEYFNRRNEGITSVTGIISPETAYNLKICPSQSLLKWHKYLGIPVVFNSHFYYYQSKDFNSTLEVDTGDNFSKEAGDINIGDDYYFFPEIKSFNVPVTRSIIEALKENPLGLIKYSYKGKNFYDYLYEIDAENEKGLGNFRVLSGRPMQIEEADVDPENLPILKYDTGTEDYMKHDSGNEDYLLYE